jgi:CheY-like chemotaxis protein
LNGYNLEVETLLNPNDCIYNFKSGHHYDIIFIDNMMHDISGVELLKILKGMKEYYIPPIVIVTANALIGAREEFLKEGFDEYLSKPLDMNELDKVINKFLKQ